MALLAAYRLMSKPLSTQSQAVTGMASPPLLIEGSHRWSYRDFPVELGNPSIVSSVSDSIFHWEEVSSLWSSERVFRLSMVARVGMGMVQEFFEIRKSGAFHVPSLFDTCFLSVLRLRLIGLCLLLAGFCLLPPLHFLQEERPVVWGIIFDHRVFGRWKRELAAARTSATGV